MPANSSSQTDVSSWLQNDFIRSFRNDADPSRWAQNDGFFAITSLCLTHVNASASLVKGSDAGTVEIVAFIKKWLGRAGAPSAGRYVGRAWPLYAVFRHGLVHAREPGQLIVARPPKTSLLTWQLSRGTDRAEHLSLQSCGTDSESRDVVRLNVQCDLLYEDILSALAVINSSLSSDQTLLANVYAGSHAQGGPHTPERHGAHIAAEIVPDAP